MSGGELTTPAKTLLSQPVSGLVGAAVVVDASLNITTGFPGMYEPSGYGG